MNKIFSENTHGDQRKYLTLVLKFLKTNYPKIKIPAVGHFTLVKCAMDAGYKKKDIYTSDVSLYTSLLGYLFIGEDIEKLNFELSEVYRIDYKKLTDPIDKVAYIFWVMKVLQLRKVDYAQHIAEEVAENKKKYIAQIKIQVQEYVNTFTGVNYKVEDLRNVLLEDKKDTITVISPTISAKGMFDFGEDIKFSIGIEEVNWRKEYIKLYKQSKSIEMPVIWYRFKDIKEFDKKEVIFAKEYKVGKVDYWLLTKPKVLKGFEHNKSIASFKRKPLKPYHLPLFALKDKLTEKSVVTFVKVPYEVGLYYRDLLAHRLGNTKAELYFLMIVDNKVFSTVGFHVGGMLRYKMNKVFECYGFSIYHPDYPHTNRLLMLMITSKEMGAVLRRNISGVNRFYEMIGMKTTCLSKYRSIKTHRGILTRIAREKLPNGMYKILAEGEFQDRDFKQTLKQFLEEEKGFKSYKQLK